MIGYPTSASTVKMISTAPDSAESRSVSVAAHNSEADDVGDEHDGEVDQRRQRADGQLRDLNVENHGVAGHHRFRLGHHETPRY